MIAIGSDHCGYILKEYITDKFKETNVMFKDFGTHTNYSVDYPDIAKKVCEEILYNECTFGVLICKTGAGMCIASNKIKKIRATLITNEYIAKKTRQHNNANVICLGEYLTEKNDAINFIKTFISTDFEGGRHINRIKKIETMNENLDKNY